MSDITGLFIGALAALVGLFVWMRRMVAKGRRLESSERERADNERAKNTQDAADRARAADDAGGGGSSVDRLRRHGRIRNRENDLP
jgi:hypothetical protein